MKVGEVMTLKARMAADARNVFLNTDEFAESISVNDATIPAVVTIGQTNAKGDEIQPDGSSDRATVEVAVADWPDPKQTDKILIGGKRWYFARIESTDGAMMAISCVTKQSAYRR